MAAGTKRSLLQTSTDRRHSLHQKVDRGLSSIYVVSERCNVLLLWEKLAHLIAGQDGIERKQSGYEPVKSAAVGVVGKGQDFVMLFPRLIIHYIENKILRQP